jgi:hypothetical protein
MSRLAFFVFCFFSGLPRKGEQSTPLSSSAGAASGSLRDALAHLAGRGDVEVDKGEAVVGGAGRCLRELLLIRLFAMFSLRRRQTSAAIQGHKGGGVALNAKMSASFFLCVRIFGSVKAASKSLA